MEVKLPINVTIEIGKDITERLSLFPKDIRYQTCNVFAKKITSIFPSLNIIESSDLVRNVSAVRYLFEAVILLRLINKEPIAFYKMRCSLMNQQINHAKEQLDRLKNEIELYKKLEDLDSTSGILNGIEIAKLTEGTNRLKGMVKKCWLIWLRLMN